ncbi:hypothetical protein B566_EDAN018575 [Ephemera danica]|nr:hypothetical protein B566_EDAN018575 [Ephemera danica]
MYGAHYTYVSPPLHALVLETPMANNEQKMSDPINSQHSMHMREAETSAQSGGSFRYVSGQFPALTDGSSSKEKVFETLKEMFLGAIDEDTLLDVLEEKLYDFNESFDALGELTSSTSTHEAARKSTSPESESELQHPSLLEYIPESAWIEAPGNTPHMKNASDSNSGPRKAASAPVQSKLGPSSCCF